MKKEYDLLGRNDEWYTVTEDYLNGVSNIEDIKTLVEVGADKLKVIYKNGKEVYYKDTFGTWGFPCTIR